VKNNLTIAVKLCDQVPLHSFTSSFGAHVTRQGNRLYHQACS